jgi:4-hydroxy-4-methyl-2-oxoglutarate aldolase
MKEIETKELCARFRKLYMPAVCDALYHLGFAEQVLPTKLRPLFPDQRMVGLALTVEGRAIEPRLGWDVGITRIRSYLKVFEEIPADSVLVSVNPDSNVGHFGELTGNAAKVRGCAGVILDGNLRDIEGLREIGFQVFYRDLSPLNAIGRWEMVASQKPVTIGSVTIHPNDLIFAEFDGILVIPGSQAVQVLVKAEEIASAEQRVRNEMREGLAPLSGLERHGYI